MRASDGGRIILMDFGAGEFRDAPTATRPHGTPLYLAPELLTGGAATIESDIYALGVLLFYLVSGRLPVEGASFSDLVLAHAQHRRQHLRDVRPDLPDGYVNVVERAIDPDPKRRFQSAGQFHAALEEGERRQEPSAGPRPRSNDRGGDRTGAGSAAGAAASFVVLHSPPVAERDRQRRCRGAADDPAARRRRVPRVRNRVARTAGIQGGAAQVPRCGNGGALGVRGVRRASSRRRPRCCSGSGSSLHRPSTGSPGPSPRGSPAPGRARWQRSWPSPAFCGGRASRGGTPTCSPPCLRCRAAGSRDLTARAGDPAVPKRLHGRRVRRRPSAELQPSE